MWECALIFFLSNDANSCITYLVMYELDVIRNGKTDSGKSEKFFAGMMTD